MIRKLPLFLVLVFSFIFLTSTIAEAKRGKVRHKTYHTYIKKHNDGSVYVGRTSGYETPNKNLVRRDIRHHMNKKGFQQAQLDKSSRSKDIIRGREQQLIEKYRAEGRSANKINGISDKNPKKKKYIRASNRKYGSP